MQIIDVVSNTITRPNDTTAYTSGDLVANSTTANLVTPFSFRIPYGWGLKVHRVSLLRSATSVTNASFRVHLYKDSPTVANGDNGAWSSTVSGWQGSTDVTGTAPAFSDSASAIGVFVNNSVFTPQIILTDVDQYIYGLLEARGAYTPAAQETFIIRLVGEVYK